MIKVRSDDERSVYADLQKRPEVKDVYRLFGEYNFFLVIQAAERARFERVLKEIEAEEKVIGTGPILLTADDGLADGDLMDVAMIGTESVATFG